MQFAAYYLGIRNHKEKY